MQKQGSDDEVSDDAEFDDTDEHLIMTNKTRSGGSGDLQSNR